MPSAGYGGNWVAATPNAPFQGGFFSGFAKHQHRSRLRVTAAQGCSWAAVGQGDSDAPGGRVLGSGGIWGWERGSEVKLC